VATQVFVKSIVLRLSDGDYDHFFGINKNIPIPLIELCLGELDLTIHNYVLKEIENNPFMAFTISEFI
jgi:hypothetical protein